MKYDVQFDSKLDYYDILGLTKDATAEEIKVAHVELALKFHPDVAKGGATLSNNSRFRSIQAAFDVLGNPTVRSKYDHARFGPALPIGPGPSSSVVPPSTYTAQKANYAHVRKAASSNWREVCCDLTLTLALPLTLTLALNLTLTLTLSLTGQRQIQN